MGLLSNPLRSHEPRLPTYRKLESPTKERFSDEEYYSSDEDSEPYRSDLSQGSSRNTSGSMSSGHLMLPRRKPASAKRPGAAYPYRLPPKVTRYLVFGVVGFILLMILSLIRASQVENWKVANGKVENRPVAPPIWEKFPFLERYYGGIRTLATLENSRPEYPRLNEPVAFNPNPTETGDQHEESEEESAVHQRDIPASSSWESYPGRNQESGIDECFIDAAGTIRVPPLRYYTGRPMGFPQNVVGSYDLLNLPEDICFERYGRFGPYGFGQSLRSGGLGTGEHGEKEGSEAVWDTTPAVDYRKVDWADVQRRCFRANADRYKTLPSKTLTPHGFYVNEVNSSAIEVRDALEDVKASEEHVSAEGDASKPKFIKSGKAGDSVEKKSRTAVVVRCWDEYLFREDDIANVRSIITELAMASGGRYDVHLLVQVKNDGAHPIWADHEAYEQRIQEAIPEEFRGLVTLWTETQMLSLYQGMFDLFTRDLPIHGVYRGLSMAMQYFAYMHPEYDFFWQWEMDVRYTGHYYDFFTKLEDWAKAQPRKGLWERNSRFYMPDVHGTWDDFSQMARVQSEMGTPSTEDMWKGVPGVHDKAPEKVTKNDKTVWGPLRPSDDNDWFEPGNDPIPPSSYDKDHYEWGVGEEADYISLNPMFDPEGTTWGLKDDITGFNRSRPLPPRRANIITTSRMSRRLLMTMHKMTAYKKQFAFPEMWPATVAIQHGYKAVFAPHPVYVDRKWPVEYMAQTFNGGRDGSSGGSRASLYGDREHHMHGLSWFYNAGFAPNLYRRWVGLKVNNDGGEEFEMTEDTSKQGPGVGNMPGGEGRMCLPPMLLHPVKEVDLPIESPPEEGEKLPVSDPAA